MCEFDVRNPDLITRIIFADTTNKRLNNKAFITKSGDGLHIRSGEGWFKLSSREDVANLIKALHKAEELGWI